jgi:hypothetical protein
LLLLVVVVVAMMKDPTRLMLGEVTGREFIEYHQLTQGDSHRGESVEPLRPIQGDGVIVAAKASLALPEPPKQDDQEGDDG